MFTPIILVCINTTCFGVAGTALPTMEQCLVNVQSAGVEFVEQTIPQGTIVDMKCIDWGADA